MTTDERQRHGLYQELEATLGAEHAATLMSMLPPVGWADVATKQDLASVENAVRSEISATERVLRSEIQSVEHRLNATFEEAMRHQLWATVGVMLVAILASLWLGRLPTAASAQPPYSTTLGEVRLPIGWADVATKDDVTTLERMVTSEIRSAGWRLESSFQIAMRQQVWATVGVMLVTVFGSMWVGR